MSRLFYRPQSRLMALKAGTLSVILLCAVDGQLADRVARDLEPRVTAFAVEAGETARDQIEPIIVRGGVTVERSRHALVGGTMGCAVGAAAGAIVTTGLGFLTGGVAWAGVSVAGAIGCGIGGLGGAAIGRPLDAYEWE